MHKPENFTFGGWNMPEQVDASRGYERARIDLVRTHDALWPRRHRLEIRDQRSPRRRADLRPARCVHPLSERLRGPGRSGELPLRADRQAGHSIIKLGAQVIFRLGRSEGADPQPPPDFDRYADIAKHIVLHYNGGWANGYHYGIRYWEVWNEPDLGKVFWAGTAEQYFALYSRSRAP